MGGSRLITPVVVAADPPWRFRDPLPGKTRGAGRNYSCLSVEELCAFSLPPQMARAPDAVLFLWRVSAMPMEALQVMNAWGFDYHSELIWRKLTKTGKEHFGMGHIFRNAHETCIVGVRGSRIRPAVRNVRSVFSAPIGRHSEKPDAFYRLVENLYPDSHRYELFARRPRAGWAQYGQGFGTLAPLPKGGIDVESSEGRDGGGAELRAVH